MSHKLINGHLCFSAQNNQTFKVAVGPNSHGNIN